MRPVLLCSLALAATLAAAPALAQRDVFPGLWAVDGDVRGMALVGDTLFVTGRFSTVGPPTGMLAAFDRSTGEADLRLDRIDTGRIDFVGVRAVAPDGRGGLFVGGRFTRAGGAVRYNLVRYRADGSLDPAFAPDPVTQIPNAPPGGLVGALLYAPALPSPSGEGVLFVGGAFNEVRDGSGVHAREDLAALDAGTGAVLPLSAVFDRVDTSAGVLALALHGGALYAGGTFTAVNGEPRRGAAAFGVGASGGGSGALLAWDPLLARISPNNRPHVDDLLVAPGFDPGSAPTLYVAGLFERVGGAPRDRLAEVTVADPATGAGGAPTPWAPAFSGSTAASFALALVGDALWAAGDYVQQGQFGLARVDRQSGVVTPFAVAPGVRSGRALAYDPLGPAGDGGPSGQGVLYLGAVQNVEPSGAPFSVVVGVDPATGQATGFRLLGGREANRQPRALHVVEPEGGAGSVSAGSAGGSALAGRLVVGGPFHFMGGRRARGLAALDLTTGRALDGYPIGGVGVPGSFYGEGVALHASPDGRFLYHYDRNPFLTRLDELDLATGAVRDFTDPAPLPPPPDAAWPPPAWPGGVPVANARSALHIGGDTLFVALGGAVAMARSDGGVLWDTPMATINTPHSDPGTVLVVPAGEDSAFGADAPTLFLSAPSDFGPTATRRAGLLALAPATGEVSDWYPPFNNSFVPLGFALDYLPAAAPGPAGPGQGGRPATLWWGGNAGGVTLGGEPRGNALAVRPSSSAPLPWWVCFLGGDGYHASVHALLALPEGTAWTPPATGGSLGEDALGEDALGGGESPVEVGGVVYVGGGGRMCWGELPRRHSLVAVPAAAAEENPLGLAPLAWDVGVTAAARTLLYSERHGALFVGGEFSGALWGSGHGGVVAVTPYGAGPPVSVSDAGAGRARGASLSAPWPNPSRGRASLTLGLPAGGDVTVAVYDVLGRRVLVAHEGPLAGGEHVLVVDVSGLPAGAYVVRASGQGASGAGGGGFAVSRRITVVR